MTKISILCLLAVNLLLATGLSVAQPSVELVRVPDNGVHPRIVEDKQHNIHLLYFRPNNPDGNSARGDLYYRQYDVDNQAWGAAVKVSSQSFNVRDPIFRADFTVDDDGRIHVVWFQDRPQQVFYTRSNPARNTFSSQRSMVNQHIDGVDAGSDIAAVGGKIVMVWAAGDLAKEDRRSVYLRQSNDFGETFGEEIEVADAALGACACCGLAAEFDRSGQLLIAYRAATNGTGRNMQVLGVNLEASESLSKDYYPLPDLRRWALSSCPVTTNDLVKDGNGNIWLVYENKGRVVYEYLNQNTSARPVSNGTPKTRQKHPAMVFNEQGYQLLAWGEGGGFFSGGSLRWLLFDGDGNPVAQSQPDTVKIPDSSFIAAMEKPDGNFVVLY